MRQRPAWIRAAETQTFKPKPSATEGATTAIDSSSYLGDGAAVSIEVVSLTGDKPVELDGSTQQPRSQPSAQQRLNQIDLLKQRQQEQMQALLLQQTQVTSASSMEDEPSLWAREPIPLLVMRTHWGVKTLVLNECDD